MFTMLPSASCTSEGTNEDHNKQTTQTVEKNKTEFKHGVTKNNKSLPQANGSGACLDWAACSDTNTNNESNNTLINHRSYIQYTPQMTNH